MSYRTNEFDIVVCSEVLEHIGNPEVALREIHRICNGYALISVPSEPIWRILNIIRGKYWHALGNTPGHINHWTAEKLVELVQSAGFKVVAQRHPFPWTMVLLKKNSK